MRRHFRGIHVALKVFVFREAWKGPPGLSYDDPVGFGSFSVNMDGVPMKPGKHDKNSGLVYSTEFGKMCPVCSHLSAQCICKKLQAPPSSDGVVRVWRETKGRKGKGVCVIKGVPLSVEDLKALGKRLKTHCGTGGTVKDGVIEIQGDHRDTLIELLKKEGWTVKRAGG